MSKLEVTIKDLETGEIKRQFETAAMAAVTIENIEPEDMKNEEHEGNIKTANCLIVGEYNKIMLMNVADALDHLKEKINDDPFGRITIESNNTEE